MKFEIQKKDLLEIFAKDNKNYDKYKKRIDLMASDETGILPAEIMSADDWRSNEQISCIKSLCNYFEKANLKEDKRGVSWLADDYLDEFKEKAEMIKWYCQDVEGKVRRFKEPPENGYWFPEYKSCANATKRQLSSIIERILPYARAHLQAGNFGSMEGKVHEAMEKIEENSRIKTEQWKKEQEIQKSIKKEFKN